jgi:hypothetical protein
MIMVGTATRHPSRYPHTFFYAKRTQKKARKTYVFGKFDMKTKPILPEGAEPDGRYLNAEVRMQNDEVSKDMKITKRTQFLRQKANESV